MEEKFEASFSANGDQPVGTNRETIRDLEGVLRKVGVQSTPDGVEFAPLDDSRRENLIALIRAREAQTRKLLVEQQQKLAELPTDDLSAKFEMHAEVVAAAQSALGPLAESGIGIKVALITTTERAILREPVVAEDQET